MTALQSANVIAPAQLHTRRGTLAGLWSSELMDDRCGSFAEARLMFAEQSGYSLIERQSQALEGVV